MLFTKLEVTLAWYWSYSYLRFYEPRRRTWRSIRLIDFFHSPLFFNKTVEIQLYLLRAATSFSTSAPVVESLKDFFRVLIFNPIRSSLSLEIRSIPPEQKRFPLGRLIPIWLIYGSNPPPPQPLSKEKPPIPTKHLREILCFNFAVETTYRHMELSWEQRSRWFCKHVITNQQKLFSTRSSTRVTHQVLGKASLKGKRSGF